MALAVPFLEPADPLRSLSGYWHTSDHGGVVQFCHWPRLRVIWSVSAHHCEELFGCVDRSDGTGRIRAHWGSTGIFEGEVSGNGNCITWCNGSTWLRMSDGPPQPVKVCSCLKSALLCLYALCSRTTCGARVLTVLLSMPRLAAILWFYLVLTVAWTIALTAPAMIVLRAANADTPLNESVGVWFTCIFLYSLIAPYLILEGLSLTRNRPRLARIILCFWGIVMCSQVFEDVYDGPQLHGRWLLWSGNGTANETGNSTNNTTADGNSTQLSPDALIVISELRCACAVAFSVAILCGLWLIKRQFARDVRAREEDPSSWPSVAIARAEERVRLIRQFNEDCRDLWFGAPLELMVEQVYSITAEGAQCFRREAESLRNNARPPIDCESAQPFTGVRSLYHGAPSGSVKSICSTGFHLPRTSIRKPLMYGGGLYFTDVPQKAWQFTGDTRYVLVCDVALGRPRQMKVADTSFSSESLQKPSLEGIVYDSVLGEDTSRGGVLSHREFVVYRTEQVLPRYLLAIRECSAQTNAERLSEQRAERPAESPAEHADASLLCFGCSLASGHDFSANGPHPERVEANGRICSVCHTGGLQGLWARLSGR